MPTEDDARIREVVTPSAHDIAVASDAIVGAMRRAGGYCSTDELFRVVAESLAAEPMADMARTLEHIQSGSLRRVKGLAVAATSVAELEARGAILPTGPHTYPLEQHDWSPAYASEGYPRGTGNMQGSFSVGLSAGYRLPVRDSRAPLVDSPGVFLLHPPKSMGGKVRRSLEEAVNAYRNGLYLATAVMLGVASEAAWGQLARELQDVRPTRQLAQLLSDPHASAAAIHKKAALTLRQLLLDRGKDIDALDVVEQSYREVRNYAAHRPDQAFDETRVARPVVGLLLVNSVDYFRLLFDVFDEIGEQRRAGTV